MRAAFTLFVAPVVAYGALCRVYVTQRGQIYFPTQVSATPGAQALWLESQGERIEVWVVARPGPRALLYFGGNAEDVAGNVEPCLRPVRHYRVRSASAAPANRGLDQGSMLHLVRSVPGSPAHLKRSAERSLPLQDMLR